MHNDDIPSVTIQPVVNVTSPVMESVDQSSKRKRVLTEEQKTRKREKERERRRQLKKIMMPTTPDTITANMSCNRTSEELAKCAVDNTSIVDSKASIMLQSSANTIGQQTCQPLPKILRQSTGALHNDDILGVHSSVVGKPGLPSDGEGCESFSNKTVPKHETSKRARVLTEEQKARKREKERERRQCKKMKMLTAAGTMTANMSCNNKPEELDKRMVDNKSIIISIASTMPQSSANPLAQQTCEPLTETLIRKPKQNLTEAQKERKRERERKRRWDMKAVSSASVPRIKENDRNQN